MRSCVMMFLIQIPLWDSCKWLIFIINLTLDRWGTVPDEYVLTRIAHRDLVYYGNFKLLNIFQPVVEHSDRGQRPHMFWFQRLPWSNQSGTQTDSCSEEQKEVLSSVLFHHLYHYYPFFFSWSQSHCHNTAPYCDNSWVITNKQYNINKGLIFPGRMAE